MRETAIAAVLAVTTIAIQAHWGAKMLTSSVSGPDAPSHYVTGVMVYDYFHHAFQSPLKFAQTFYVRFPKVALGHWPPGLYLLEAAWFTLLGPTILSARLLSVATGMAMAVCIGWRLRAGFDRIIAVGCAAAFFGVVPVRQAVWTVGSDLLVGGLMLCAMLAFADFLGQPRWRPALLFGLWCGAALLTKGSAWACGIAALLAPVLCRKTGCYRSPWYYLAGMLACAIGAPFYLLAHHYADAYPARFEHLTSAALPMVSRWNAVPVLFKFLPGVFAAVAVVGLAASLRLRWLKGDRSPAVDIEIAAGAWALGQIVFLFVLPLTEEGRVYLPALAVLVFPFARGLETLRAIAHRAGPHARWIPAGLVLLTVANGPAMQLERPEGFRQAARAIPFFEEGTLMLVSSTGTGDGDWIAERLSADPYHAGVIFRADRLLAQSDWGGHRYQLKVQDPGEIRRILLETPIRYAILIDYGDTPPHQKLLEQVLRGEPQTFIPIASFFLQTDLPGRVGTIDIYENRLAGNRHPAVVRVPLGLSGGGRMLEYRWP